MTGPLRMRTRARIQRVGCPDPPGIHSLSQSNDRRPYSTEMDDSKEISTGSRRWSPAAGAVVGGLYVLGLAVAALSAYGLAVSRGPATSSLIILTAAYLPYATVGSILVARRPANAIGWVLLALGWTFAFSFLPIPATADDLQMGTASPFAEAIAWLQGVGAPLTLALFALLALVFPTGRLADGRWRRAAALLLVLTWGLVALSALWPVLTVLPAGPAGTIEIPNPIAFLPPSILGTRLMSNPGVAALPVILIASIAAIITRYARARGLERLQLRWLVAALASIALAVLAGLAILAVLGPGAAIAWVPAAVAFMLPPIAIGIAVMRYRLYELDLIINRALVYGVLGLLVAVGYLVMATALGRLAGGEGSPATATVATVIAALVALAARQAVQHAIDRLLYGRRGDPLAVIGSVARRLGERRHTRGPADRRRGRPPGGVEARRRRRVRRRWRAPGRNGPCRGRFTPLARTPGRARRRAQGLDSPGR